MTLNSQLYPNGSEVELPERSPFTLHCHGNGSSAGWSSSAFMLRFEDSLGRTLTVGRSAPRHTGTYRCGDAWIHLYIRGLTLTRTCRPLDLLTLDLLTLNLNLPVCPPACLPVCLPTCLFTNLSV